MPALPVPTARPTRTAGVLVAGLVALLVSMTLVWDSSRAAWTGVTENGPDTWSTGTVALADDDGGVAMFSATGLRPGSTGERCITVTSTGTLPSAVRFYAGGLTTTNGLSAHLLVDVSWGTGGSSGSCASFVPEGVLWTGRLSTIAATTYATGLGSWTTTGVPGEERVYRIGWTLSASAPDSAQGGTAGATFTWEAQNV